MDADLQPLYDRVMRATRPEEVFREMNVILPRRLLEEHLKPEIEVLRKVLGKDAYTSHEDREAANTAREKLEQLYNDALVKAEYGTYNLDGFTPLLPLEGGQRVTIQNTEYVIGGKRHIGEHSALYDARFSIDGGSAGAVIRVANTPQDNPYLHNEIRVLDQLHKHDVGYWRYLPFVFGRFSSGDRVGLVYRLFEGFTLEEIRINQLHKNGLDQRHMIWILDRMLNLLGYAHKVGIVHGRIDPTRMRVRPSNHNVLLSGWNQAVYKPAITGETIGSLGGAFEAPEVLLSGKVGPWTDIYSLGKTMVWLVGGDPSTNKMPDTVEPKIQRFLRHMVQERAKARPHNAWQLYKAQNKLKDSLWERRFRHLDMA